MTDLEPGLEPLGTDLETLLAAERNAPGPDGALRQRLWDGVQTRLALPPAPVLPDAGAGNLLGTGKLLAVFVAGLTAGAVGATWVAHQGGSAPQTPALAVPNAPPSVGAPRPPSTPEAMPPEPSPSPKRLAPGLGAVAEAELAAERVLVERAQAAWLRRDAAATLEATELHRQRFPRGRLGEEREALAVQALVAAGRQGEAEARAAAFFAQFPRSLFRQAVEAALGPGAAPKR